MGISITFNTGLSGGSITLVTPTVVYGTDYYDEVFNQNSLRTADGELITYGNITKVVNGVILMKGVSFTEGDNFRTWLREKAIFAQNKFTITPPTELDLGRGKGNSIAFCNFVGTNTKGVFKYEVPGVFKINFPYTFLNTVNTLIRVNIPISIVPSVSIEGIGSISTSISMGLSLSASISGV